MMQTDLSKAEVERYIQEFLDGTGEPWDWDDFVSSQLRDPALEVVRMQCASLPERFPSAELNKYCSDAGLVEMRRLLEALRMQRE